MALIPLGKALTDVNHSLMLAQCNFRTVRNGHSVVSAGPVLTAGNSNRQAADSEHRVIVDFGDFDRVVNGDQRAGVNATITGLRLQPSRPSVVAQANTSEVAPAEGAISSVVSMSSA